MAWFIEMKSILFNNLTILILSESCPALRLISRGHPAMKKWNENA
tara:strand:- start:913 stop:1047 length:135 start_codon:yes stop_codon:yes gene_type:complete